MFLKTLEKKLRNAFTLDHLTLEDRSYFHRHHKQNTGVGGHYHLTLVSKDFESLGPVAAHRKVYEALGMPGNEDIHALSLNTFTPEKWKAQNAS